MIPNKKQSGIGVSRLLFNAFKILLKSIVKLPRVNKEGVKTISRCGHAAGNRPTQRMNPAAIPRRRL
jgi:hypothetical protein